MSKLKAPDAEDWNSASEEEEEWNCRKREHFSHNFNKLCIQQAVDNEADSGLPSTGRGASSYVDLDLSDSEERGVYDYFPTNETKLKTESIKISHIDKPEFDEAIDVESDKSSVDSPNSDASSTNEYNVTNPLEEEGTELKTFSHHEFPSYGTNIHKSMYSSRNEVQYMQLKNSDDEEYCQTPVQHQRKYRTGSVDDTVCFPLRSFSHSHDEAESGGYKPPFGCRDQLNNVGTSIGRLLSSHHDLAGAFISDETRKKKPMRKKKGSKDDTDERLNSKTKKNPMQNDENGNPIADLRMHRQMRDLNSKATEGSLVSSRKFSNNGFPPNEFTSQFDSFPLPGHTLKDADEAASSTDRKKHRNKKAKEPLKLAEDIPNYVGNLPNVDDLVKFITTQNIGEKQLKKKISQKTSPGLETVPKADKLSKKNKEKKGKPLASEESLEAPGGPPPESSVAALGPKGTASNQEAQSVKLAAGNLGSPVQADSVVIEIEADITVEACSKSEEVDSTPEKDMGNSSDKAAASNISVSSPSVETGGQDKIMKSEVETSVESKENIDKVTASKSPPLQKKDLESKDKNKNKTKEKEKSVEPVPQTTDNNKKPKGKNGKSEGHLKNNKKLEIKSDEIPDTKPVDKIQSEAISELIVNKLKSDLALNDNQDYIFTDIDNLPPVEQEFTLVSKKKKRQGAKEVFPEFHRPKNGPREYRGVPQARSITPPPTSVLKKEQARDLSPSAFPALGKKASGFKGGSVFREGRRNSLGDVPIDSLTELRSQDDSDIESVKSLPAAKGGSLSDVVSSRFPVSYAKMAAAPKPPHSPNSPKSDEEEMDIQEDRANTRKPTVWKGSMTERRHSIGSSPEDSKLENSPKLSQRSRQKSGSQEFLLLDSVKNDVDVPGVGKDVQSSPVQNDSTCDDNLVVTEGGTQSGVSPRSQSVSLEDQPCSQTVPTITVTLDSSKDIDTVVNDPNGPTKVLLNGPLNGPTNGPTNGPQGIYKTEVFSHSDVSRSQNSMSKDSRSKPVSVRVNNNYNKKNNKSVIFLDKRFRDAPEKLDITFGFDSNFDHDEDRQSEPPGEGPDSVEDFRDQNQIEPQNALPTSIAASSGHSSSILTKNVGTAVPPTGAPSMTSKALKTQVGGLNGVVLPKTQGSRNSHGADVLRTNKTAESSGASKDKTVLFFYGEGIVVQTDSVSVDSRGQTPGTSQYKGQLAFSPDVIATSEGKFNVNEAIKYLKQEWDKVLEQKNKNPKAVQFYNGQ